MSKFLQTAKAAAFLILSILFIFLLSLILDAKSGLVAAAVMLTGMFGTLVYFFLSYLSTPHHKRKSYGLLLRISCLLLSGAALTGITIANEALYKVLPHSSLNPVDKIFFYQEALSYSEAGHTRLTYLQSLKSKSMGGVNFYYEKDDALLAKNMVRHSIEVNKIMTAFTGGFPLKPVNLIFYSNPFIFQANVPKHRFDSLKGMYVPSENTIHLFIGENDRENEEAVLKRFAHEYAHHMIVSYLEFHGLDNRHLPRWFEEGTAEYAAEKSIQLRPPFRPLNIIPFKKMHTQKQWEDANRKTSPHHPYRQSFYAVDELIQLAGARQVGNLMVTTSAGTFYEAFEQVSGMSMEKFQVVFLAEEMKLYRNRKSD